MNMNEYETGCVKVDGKYIETRCTNVYSANILSVEAGTTGYMGGDTGHGGRTYFKIKDEGGTDMRVNSKDGELEVVLGGDCELTTMIIALRFIAETLEEQVEEKSGD